jgi:hypothetical protein
MARQAAAVEINAFVKGIITEASPLTFPDNASIDEVNFVLNKDGSRRRRLGMDYEPNYQLVTTNQAPVEDMAISSFLWKVPGGFPDEEFSAIQTGNRVTILNRNSLPVSANVVSTYDIGSTPSSKMSMTSIDGLLVVVTGDGSIYSIDYDGTSTSLSSNRLKVRDQFGVEDVVSGENLLEGQGLTVRPTGRTDTHIYNLRNQTFAIPRKPSYDEDIIDPIGYYRARTGRYQSNSDNLVTFLYSDANDSDDRSSRRYFWDDANLNPLGTNKAPMGYFIIDALNRGASRMTEIQALQSKYPQLTELVGSLPADRTPGGATVLGSYAGRVWYAGFNSQVIGGDDQSPRMTSYVLFSRLVQTGADIYKCYQEGDPTSSETPDLVDTDGGFLRLDGAFNIQQMVNVGDALMVIAENGVWKITGGSGYGFNATNYLTSKVTEHGSIAPSSVVIMDNTFMYWSDDGIYHVSQNQYGDWTGTNITNTTIQALYDDIPYLSKVRCQGLYDSYGRQVRWLYNNYFGAAESAKELVLDVNLSAFYPTLIQPVTGAYPRPLSMIRVPPFSVATSVEHVIDNSGNPVVTASGNTLTVNRETTFSAVSEIYYLTADGVSGGNLQFTFSYYRDTGFLDWKSKNGVGRDAPAYLVTGWAGMGDFQRQKQVPYITVYSYKTETGFTSEMVPVNSSSIKVQSQWSWTNSAEAGKWGPTFQAYRHKRLWIPANDSSGFDDGELVVTTRSKLRGRGRVLSIKFTTEPGYDFHLLGWSYLALANGSV